MALCKECGGDEFDHVQNVWHRTLLEQEGLFRTRYTEKERPIGSIWQCRKCKRVFHYYGTGWIGDGKLPCNKERV